MGFGMRFVFTMNMPSNRGKSIHQVIGEYPVASEEAMNEALNELDFICIELLYSYAEETGSTEFQSRGKMVLNTSLIGKVQRHFERERATDY